MTNCFKPLLLFVLLHSTVLLFGQSKTINDLRQQKEKAAKEIEYINKLLKEMGQTSKNSLNRLSILENRFKLQNSIISNINAEIEFIDQSIATNSLQIDSLTKVLGNVKANYASMIRYARRNQDANNQLLFLLSADDFNQAYKRFVYLRQISDYRKSQIVQIEEIQKQLSGQIEALNSRKADKENLLLAKVTQAREIEQQKTEQSAYYAGLQQKEKDLRRKLDAQRKSEARLQQEIERIIAEEARKIAAKSKKDPGFTMTPEDKVLSGDFANNKGRLPWPVGKGIITSAFGEHPHPVLKHVMVRNSGIDIATQTGGKARVVFKGEVSKVVAIPGGNMAVIVRHGNYLTVYSNLVNVLVQSGQIVDTKQEIGSIYTDPNEDNKTVLKFQLWRENVKLDPQVWISNQ